jgi:hypothetical protein
MREMKGKPPQHRASTTGHVGKPAAVVVGATKAPARKAPSKAKTGRPEARPSFIGTKVYAATVEPSEHVKKILASLAERPSVL